MDNGTWSRNGGWASSLLAGAGSERTAAEGDPAVAGVIGELLECMPNAALLMDVRGRVTLLNQAAVELISRSEGLSVASDRRLVLVHRPSREALLQVLARCAGLSPPEYGARQIAQSLVLPRSGGQPLLLTMRQFGVHYCGAVALLTLIDPESQAAVPSTFLRSVYGLSPAEARLAQAIASGMSLKQAAARDGLTYETVRTYVKQVLAKMGARRQADVVRLVGGLRDADSWSSVRTEVRAALP